jgi:hypothetical protein
MKEIKILQDILSSESSERAALVSKFQYLVWRGRDEREGANVEIDEILSDLAYDLDFYEPNATLRKESLSYYNDERLEREISSALQRLKEYQEVS